jgi:hypothetical protein
MSTIDTTGIDETKPTEVQATTKSVRDNTSAVKTQLGNAKTDIESAESRLTTNEADIDALETGIADLSGVTDAATARTNLGVYSQAESDALVDDLSGVTDAATARTNLGVYSATETDALVDDLSGVTDAATARSNLDVYSQAETAALHGRRNAIINGNFDIWQRGTSFTPAALSRVFLADRWNVYRDGSGSTVTFSRLPFALGQTNVPGEPTYALRCYQTVAGTGGTYNIVQQFIEGVRTFAGQTVTLSFYARAASGINLPEVAISQSFGTGGSPSAEVGVNLDTNVALTTTWQKFTYTATLPSISGKTLGTNGDDHVRVRFFLPVNQISDISIARVQLESGSVATPFEQRSIGEELALCQRYFQDSRLGLQGTATAASQVVTASCLYPVQMRDTPTITNNSDTPVNGTLASFSNSKYGLSWQLTSTAAGFMAQNTIYWTADAEL